MYIKDIELINKGPFKRFNLKEAGMVNLIGGKPGIGKTYLLKSIKKIAKNIKIAEDVNLACIEYDDKNKPDTYFFDNTQRCKQPSWVALKRKAEDLLVTVYSDFCWLYDDENCNILYYSKSENKYFPISRLGGSAQKIMNLFLKAALAQDGVFLADNVFDGIHHSVKDEVAKVLLWIAETLNVQMFLTTHDYETIYAFCPEGVESDTNGDIKSYVYYRLGCCTVDAGTRDEMLVHYGIRHSADHVAVITRRNSELR